MQLPAVVKPMKRRRGGKISPEERQQQILRDAQSKAALYKRKNEQLQAEFQGQADYQIERLRHLESEAQSLREENDRLLKDNRRFTNELAMLHRNDGKQDGTLVQVILIGWLVIRHYATV